MGLNPFAKTKNFEFTRTYNATPELVWRAWTEPELLRQWWAPEKTSVTDCEVDLRVGGEVFVVMEAGAEMGKYGGTRWPMRGTFTEIAPVQALAYDARSWTEGSEADTTIEHTNRVTMASNGATTTVNLTIDVTKIGPKAKMAAFGMKMGYKAYLNNLETVLDANS